MKKNSNGSKSMKLKRSKTRPCLMAYTLNNTQPVICTLVADQPYFYMDEEQSVSEDEVLGLDIYADFDAELNEIKSKIESLDRISQFYEREPQRRLEEFSSESINFSEDYKSNLTTSQNIIEKIVNILSQSRMAKSLFDYAHDNQVYLVESHQEQSTRYDKDAKMIFVNPNLNLDEASLLVVRELRRHWQHKQGVMIHPLTFHPDHAILINRAQQADLSIAMVRTGWELQLAGEKNVWQYIESSNMADLGRAYAREAFTDFRSINTGKAALSVFEQWFLSERCRHQDKKLIQQMLADHEGYVFQDVASSRMVSIDLISALGEQPFGKNYLASSARMIIEDPIFTEVRDRSNANFLWFVKFERTCRESEQALQSEKGIFGENPFNAPHPLFSGDTQDGKDQIILQFSPNVKGASNVTPIRTNGANVIHVRFGKG